MTKRYVCIGVLSSLASLQTILAEEIKTNENDTIKTYNIGEVIITSSTKETNNLHTLPGAISFLSPQMIAGKQVDALKDISSFVPNLYMPDYGSKLTSAIYIRGIGARSSGQSIGLYVDDAPFLDKSTFDFELTDIQRIEVLRGPQGTLYGRNAMGGIVNIYTLSPFDFQGKRFSVSAGNYGQFKVKASHYDKLSETIGFTAAAYYDRSDGFFRNEYTGKKADKEQSVGGRLKLEGRFSPNFTAAYSVSFDYTDQGAFPYGAYDKATGTVKPVNFNDPSTYTRKMLNNNLRLVYKTDRIALTSTTGYQYFKDDMKMDQDFDTTSVFTLNQKQKQHAVSEELAIKSMTNNNYQWSFGLYGFYEGLHTDGPVTFKEDGIRDILQKTFDQIKENNPNMPVSLKVMDNELYIPGSFETPSYGFALFHQSTYNNLFVKGLSLTAGIRLDYEKQKMSYQSEARMKLGVSMAPGMPPVDLNQFFPYPTSVIDEQISQDFWQVLPKVSLKYECTPTTFTYVSVAKGYKAGGYNVQMSADVMQSQMQYDMMNAVKDMLPLPINEPLPLEQVAAYKPEFSWNYEAGIRSELIDNRLKAELTGFYMDIRDVQLTKFVNSGSGRILTNAGKAQSYGVELSLRARLTDGLTADFNYGFTRATFRDYISEEKNDKSEIVKTDCKGKFIPYTPRHTVSAGLQYTKMFRGCWLDQFTASAQFSGAGKIYWTEKNDLSQKFYGTLNAKVGVRKGIFNVNVWSKNMTDATYTAFYFESFRHPFMQLGKPFQIGAELAVAF